MAGMRQLPPHMGVGWVLRGPGDTVILIKTLDSVYVKFQ